MGLFVLLAGCGAMAVERASRGSNDFDGFHEAARLVWERGELSEGKATSRYPPLFPLMLAPLGALPVGWAAALWFLASVAALFALPGRLAQLTGVAPSAQVTAWCITAPFVVDDLILGQSGVLLLYLATQALVWARAGAGTAGGFLLGVCAGLKLLPAVLLAVPLVLGRAWGTLAGLGLFGVSGLLLAVALLGADGALEGVERWQELNTERQTPWALVQWGRSMRYNNQALATVLARTFADIETRQARGQVQLTAMPLATLWWIYAGLVAAIAWRGLAAARAAARLVRRAPDAGEEADLAWGGLSALSALAMLLAAPLVWTHYFVWTLPAFVVTPLSSRARWVLGTLFVGGLAAVPARALGVQLWVTLALFVVLSGVLSRRDGGDGYPERTQAAPAPEEDGAAPAASTGDHAP